MVAEQYLSATDHNLYIIDILQTPEISDDANFLLIKISKYIMNQVLGVCFKTCFIIRKFLEETVL